MACRTSSASASVTVDGAAPKFCRMTGHHHNQQSQKRSASTSECVEFSELFYIHTSLHIEKRINGPDEKLGCTCN